MSEAQSDILKKIRRALSSSKVDAYMLLEFEGLYDSMPENDLINMQVAFLAQVRQGVPMLKGELTRIGNIVAITTPYFEIPDLVNNPNVINLEASRSSFLYEANLRKNKPYTRMFYVGTIIIVLAAFLLVLLGLAGISVGGWIFAPLLLGFIIQMFGLYKSRPRASLK